MTSPFARFLDLCRELKDAETVVDRIKGERALLEHQLLKEMERDGVQALTMNGSTLYLHRQVWVRPKDGEGEALAKTLLAHGLGSLVKESISTQSLSAWYREREQEGGAPAEIGDLLRVDETFSVRVRKA